jgi:hypothetical protein
LVRWEVEDRTCFPRGETPDGYSRLFLPLSDDDDFDRIMLKWQERAIGKSEILSSIHGMHPGITEHLLFGCPQLSSQEVLERQKMFKHLIDFPDFSVQLWRLTNLIRDQTEHLINFNSSEAEQLERFNLALLERFAPDFTKIDLYGTKEIGLIEFWLELARMNLELSPGIESAPAILKDIELLEKAVGVIKESASIRQEKEVAGI